MWFFWILLITFTVSFFGTYLVRFVALKLSWVAQPKADRWHTTPTALHGGVGIYLAFTVGALLYLLYYINKGSIPSGLEDLTEQHFVRRFLVILGSVTIIFLVGLVDDFFQLRPVVKLLGEMAAVSLAVFLGIGYNISPYPWFDLIFSYLWFVGIINATNLLDNMDGVSSGIVMIGGIGVILLGWVGYTDYLPVSVYLGALLVISALGFWLHNKPPAKIFMGDSGSLVLGFVFASITIPSEFNAYYVPTVDFSIWDKVLQLAVAVTLAAIPILDTTLVTITRLLRGQSPAVGGKDHSTHRLAQSGLTHWQTLKILYGVSAICVFIAVIMVRYPEIGCQVFGVAFVSLAIVAVYLASVRIQVAPIKKEGWQQLVTSIAYRIPLIKMVMDVILIGLSFQFAYLLRFDFHLPYEMAPAMLEAMPVVIACCLGANFFFRVYNFSWRSASSRDIANYVASAFAGTVLSLAVVTILTSFSLGYSRGAYIIFCIIYFLVLTGSRFSYRFIDDLFLRLRLSQTLEGKIPLLIYGTDRNSLILLDEIQHETEKWSKYRVIGFVSSKNESQSGKIQGVFVKSENEWKEHSFSVMPEVIVADDNVDNHSAKQFCKQLGSDVRGRRFIRKLIEI